MTRSTVFTSVLILAFCVWSSPVRLEGQSAPEPVAQWDLAGLRMGFCIDFLMDSTAATKQVRKVDKTYQLVPASQYLRLHPALEALVGIYRKLFEKIPQRNFDVLSKRVSLSTTEKMRLAGSFAWKALLKN